MNKLITTTLVASLLATALPAVAETPLKAAPETTRRVSVTAKPSEAVGVELAQAARQVCVAALRGGRKNLDYPSCVVETLDQARADYAALRASGPANAKPVPARAS